MMNRLFLLFFCAWLWSGAVVGQTDSENFTPDRPALMKKLVALPCNIQESDSKALILSKIEQFLVAYQPDPAYPDDALSKESVLWALRGVQSGGYGIGAVIADRGEGLLHGAHNAQIQQNRSDLHAEMTLLTEFESKKKFRKYLKSWAFTGGDDVYASSLTVYSSAEPCPMCFVRLSIAGVKTKYVATGPDDGMASRVDCLPPFWAELGKRHPVEKAQSAPVLQRIAHVLFFSYLL